MGLPLLDSGEFREVGVGEGTVIYIAVFEDEVVGGGFVNGAERCVPALRDFHNFGTRVTTANTRVCTPGAVG